MPCYKPLTAYRQEKGVTFKRPHRLSPEIQLPCGQCIGCRLDRSKAWAIRCVHEASLHRHNCFLTLTYNDQSLPKDGSLNHEHFQTFMKALRHATSPKTVRYYMCGEYGDELGRPHYHALIFNHDFMDKYKWAYRQGNIAYRSEKLSKLWPHGFSEIGNVTFQSAAYVARYVMKKITGEQADKHYEGKTPEYNRMSLKPGIGKDWFDKYQGDVFPSDQVVTSDGKTHKTPKYYDILHEREKPFEHELIKATRRDDLKKYSKDLTPKRLKTRETVAKARNRKLIRTLT